MISLQQVEQEIAAARRRASQAGSIPIIGMSCDTAEVLLQIAMAAKAVNEERAPWGIAASAIEWRNLDAALKQVES